MSRLWRSFREKPEFAFPVLIFAVLMVHGALIGLTDDEAYYWVLAQKPAWSYAFHPPAVAWCIALSQLILGPFFGANSALVVRFPAAFCIALSTGLTLGWIREASAGAASRLGGAALVLISLPGIFALSWMMVPDLPLILGWTLAFVSTWKIIEGRSAYLGLIFGVMLALLSKYSGVLVAGSAGLAILIWAPRQAKLRACAAVILGAMFAAVPLLVWNASHEWASILYQIRDRHEGGGGISLSRYGRFWGAQFLAAGPFLLYFGFSLLPKVSSRRVFAYCWVFAVPAVLVFCLQPLWADFKPHWALIGWWPLMIAFAWAYANGSFARLARAQTVYGMALAVFVLVSCHFPIGGWVTGPDPKMDVTNDLYGWPRFSGYLKSLSAEDLALPVVGSRYQTASQAYFALGTASHVTLLPRDHKSIDEWPDLSVSKSQGPEWPTLLKPVLYVMDNRYDLAPEFPGAQCKEIGKLEENRGGRLAKWIAVWKCLPAPVPSVAGSTSHTQS